MPQKQVQATVFQVCMRLSVLNRSARRRDSMSDVHPQTKRSIPIQTCLRAFFFFFLLLLLCPLLPLRAEPGQPLLLPPQPLLFQLLELVLAVPVVPKDRLLSGLGRVRRVFILGLVRVRREGKSTQERKKKVERKSDNEL